jgi:hypothetical protein
MPGVGESSSQNFVISWSVMLQRAVTGRQDGPDVAGRKSSNRRIIVSSRDAIDTSGYSRRRSPAIADLGRNAGGTLD